jgi:hypothetical protein
LRLKPFWSNDRLSEKQTWHDVTSLIGSLTRGPILKE